MEKRFISAWLRGSAQQPVAVIVIVAVVSYLVCAWTVCNQMLFLGFKGSEEGSLEPWPGSAASVPSS